ncbi:hypothetical protein [Dyella tabacisoli]|uniref:PIG-L family deacetylase n=1 Tax=Dyella tabacisoli TaxID=2282381 RepID=A0A369UPK0_9GAMM|nr:hypothetical protein [Dyella tabacisoli]RDD82461.1 hypothetical protein DVJ77_05810 [Dyella tabacisoli]
MTHKNGEPHRRALLVIGHPGHELRVFGWLAQTRPLVCALTDGSGSDETPRTDKTRAILGAAGATIGPIFGELSDRQIYKHMLEQDSGPFEDLCERLVQLIVEEKIEIVVSDAIEGYNPTHDLCEVLVHAAVEIANIRQQRETRHYIIPLMGDPCSLGDGSESEHIEVILTQAQFQQKLATVRDYASSAGITLQQEAEDTFRTFGEEAFSREYLFASTLSGLDWERRFDGGRPFYETYGEKQVAAGRYQFVIRFREHVLPLANRLEKHVAEISASISGGRS